MSSPLVSVITPAYNAEKFIAETIQSVQAQTYTDWEMIIVDDGSTDKTADIIKEFSKHDNRIQYHYQPNGKQGKARNLAIKQAKGKYLAFIDADDLWVENKLERQLKVFTQYPQVDLVYTNGVSFKGSIENVTKEHKEIGGMIDKTLMFQTMLNGKSLPNLSVIVKKECVDAINGFAEDYQLQNAEDYQLWLRLADNSCQMYGLEENLFYYRLHENQVTANCSTAFEQAIWATYLADLKQINLREKRAILIQRVNRYLVHYIDELPKERQRKVLDLYRMPLRTFPLYFLNKGLLVFGKTVFKKYHYRFTKLNK